MTQINEFDKTIGAIAGAIYTDIAIQFPQPPLLLVPGLTFKVRRIMEPFLNLGALTKDQRKILAHEIQVAIIPMLFSLDIEYAIIEQVTPIIETAAYKALEQAA